MISQRLIHKCVCVYFCIQTYDICIYISCIHMPLCRHAFSIPRIDWFPNDTYKCVHIYTFQHRLNVTTSHVYLCLYMYIYLSKYVYDDESSKDSVTYMFMYIYTHVLIILYKVWCQLFVSFNDTYTYVDMYTYTWI